ncbi:MAG TPA: hypothetical protein VL481_01735 [Verrucomicrobiae bacterium]|jgi:hypothetical protein|nr:hypothetical protein [Verrucomicrobiae bacterium]
MTKQNLIATITLGLLGIVIVAGFFVSQNYTTANKNSQQAALTNQEKAYENVVKDSLDVYRSRYSHYPGDYQTLLDDMAKSPDIYGVNSEGMSELKNITNTLGGFSYSTIGDKDYMFTYQKAGSGETTTVTNK